MNNYGEATRAALHNSFMVKAGKVVQGDAAKAAEIAAGTAVAPAPAVAAAPPRDFSNPQQLLAAFTAALAAGTIKPQDLNPQVEFEIVRPVSPYIACCARNDLLLFHRRALHPSPTSPRSVLLLLPCPLAPSPAPSPTALLPPSSTSSTSSSPPSTSVPRAGTDFYYVQISALLRLHPSSPTSRFGLSGVQISTSPTSRFDLSDVQIRPLRRPDSTSPTSRFRPLRRPDSASPTSRFGLSDVQIRPLRRPDRALIARLLV